MSRIFWDTNLFIYLYEQDDEYFDRLRAMLSLMTVREDELVTSWMSIAELQVQPRRTGRSKQCADFVDAMREQTTILAFDENTAETFVAIRATTNVRGPDAIQLACAGAYGVEVFITNDRALQLLRVPGIHFITGLDQAPI